MRGGTRLGQLVAVLALAALMASSRPATAAGGRIAELTTMLSSSSEKTRLSAVLSLARLQDKSAMKPLVTALSDPNAQIRAVAATALGKLGHKAALPALKTAALDDVDESVRKSAREAALVIAKANKIPSDLPDAPAATQDVMTTPVQARKPTTGFGRSPHAVEDRPDLYVIVKGCNDDSPGKADKPTRKAHAEILATTLKDSLRGANQVTMVDNDAQRWGLEQRQLDVSVVKLEVNTAGPYVEVAVELRLAISDNRGKMLSFLSGGAKVQVPASKYKPQYLANMRKEALEGALKGLFDKLLTHLRQITTT
jgi:HEAT repeats